MPTSILAFRVGLFEEHLEEASFLYSQCRYMRQDATSSWRALAPFERRLELHIDALVVGAELALSVCRRRALEGDAGEVFAAVSVFCRQTQATLLSEVLSRLDSMEPDFVAAVSDALKFELPPQWLTFVDQALVRRDAHLTRLLAPVTAYRRLPLSAAATHALSACPIVEIPFIEALGQLRIGNAQLALGSLLQNPNVAIKASAILALLRMGVKEPLDQCHRGAPRDTWTRIPLGLAGGQSANEVLLQVARSTVVDSDCLLALGLLGDPASLQLLYDNLENPDLVDSAVLALNWITGADLFDEVFVPEEVKEDELFEKEINAWRERKETPKRADGKPFGETLRKLSANKGTWKRWFADNASRFDANLRYRRGKLYSPRSLLENLVVEGSGPLLRRFAALELEIRYGCDVAFEIDMAVERQVQALRAIDVWVNVQGGHFQSGRWYLNGELQ